MNKKWSRFITTFGWANGLVTSWAKPSQAGCIIWLDNDMKAISSWSHKKPSWAEPSQAMATLVGGGADKAGDDIEYISEGVSGGELKVVNKYTELTIAWSSLAPPFSHL